MIKKIFSPLSCIFLSRLVFPVSLVAYCRSPRALKKGENFKIARNELKTTNTGWLGKEILADFGHRKVF